MKISGVLAVLLMVFESIHGLEDVIITCSEQWLRVRVKWQVLGNHQEPRPSELYLGTRCAATGRPMGYYEFFYSISQCGIRAEVRLWGILIESSINYEPENSDVWGFLPISCYIQRSFTLNYSKKVKDDKGDASKKPARKKSSRLLEAKNTGTRPEGAVSIAGPYPISPSRLSMEIYL
ncbi:putative oocyte-secreted protein 1 homolog isoform X2 [Heterocephalus glaber]|uniref:Oocyte-secreted protein 1 homolog isoform X2 n=1 Tax=Heterocephalus glaber TaxID=10181 RepID=A0AAX6S4X7_HETGA|nr:putative oocyte-secreted protein 1 homolog isoform X2 [Heterocephalus glaber]